MSEATGIRINPIGPRSIAGISAFRDHRALRAALQLEFEIRVPTGPAFVQSGPITLACLAPTRFLASAHRTADLPTRLVNCLGKCAAITDQSDLWASFSVAGTHVREVLARIVPIDLNAAEFPCGALCLTRAGHLDVRLFHVEPQIYEIWVARSYAPDLEYALSQAVRGA